MKKVLTTTVKCCKIHIAVAQSDERIKLESKGFLIRCESRKS